MEFLKANYEKLALGVLIAALVYVIAGQIMLIGNVDNVKLSGGGVGQIPEKKVNAPDFKQASITKDGNGPFLTKDVLYCMKQSCHFLIPSDVAHCPDCGEPVIGEPPVEVKIKDSDKDGMEDAWEIKYGLNPLDAKDATVDTDGDGFLNSEEYGDSDEDRTSPKDPEDRPAVAKNRTYEKTYRKTQLFIIVG